MVGAEDVWVAEGPCIDYGHINYTLYAWRPKIVESGPGWVLVEVPNGSCLIAKAPTCTVAVTVRRNNSVVNAECGGNVEPVHPISALPMLIGALLLGWILYDYRRRKREALERLR